MSKPPDKSRLVYYFCDESSQVVDEWLAVAGLAATAEAIPKISRALKEIKEDSPKKGEVKWANAKSYGGVVHRAYIDYLFRLIEARVAHFHIRFSPMNEYDHHLSGDRKRTDTVSKSYYQLILHRAIRYYGKNHQIVAHPDDGECTSELPNLLGAFRADEGKKFPDHDAGSLIDIQPRSSESEPLLQLLDVTLGALTAYRNARHTAPEISATKRELMKYAFAKTRWPRIAGSSPIDLRTLNRWNVQPSLKKRD